MRAACLVVLTACGASATATPPAAPEPAHSALAEEDLYKPSYGKPELSRALISERGAEATSERVVAELEAKAGGPAVDDPLRIALADLAVRRRFIATLEACQAAGRLCPPRLDEPAWSFDPDPDRPSDPPMTSVLRFDVESWRGLSAELFGRACACRTIACVDSVGVAIDLLEKRPMPHVLSDDTASTSITRARECLFRLRGKAAIRVAAPSSLSGDE